MHVNVCSPTEKHQIGNFGNLLLLLVGCLVLQVLKEQLAQAAAAKERSGSAEHAEYAKNVVVNYLETRDPSLLPALRQVMHRLKLHSNMHITECSTRAC
jgi:hypothetical protein